MKTVFLMPFILVTLHIFICPDLYAQGRPYEGPDDPAGDLAAERIGTMNGNRVLLDIQNNTILGNWPKPNHAIWPNNQDGVNMHDDINLLIGTRVFIENDSIPVDNPDIIAFRTDLDTLYFVQTKNRTEMDTNPEGTIEWGFYPVFGYFNTMNEYPAMSNRPESWPPAGWPAQGDQLKWPGEWNGRFGRGIAYADLECYFVANDAHDQEYLQPGSPVKYYPRPGVRIGDKNPNVLIQRGYPWGGIGLRVEVRGLQWNNRQARDAIFFEYNIANISDYDLTEVVFGYFMNGGIGGEPVGIEDDIGYFDKLLDLAYYWDTNGVGAGGIRTGIMGMAFLESPGIPWDGIDNDDDGITDEMRDNYATSIVGSYDGISNLSKFLNWYGMQESDLREHWDADEDQDWDDGEDRNENGVYDEGEPAGNDVGLDGVGPADLNYSGPDIDGTECNHRPDFIEGIGCEPDFGLTDIAETDMLGLTTYIMRRSPEGHLPGDLWWDLDKQWYEYMTSNQFIAWTGEVVNFEQTFASGTFPLHKGRTEHISMAEIHSYEDLSGLNSSEHSAPSLFLKKRVVQVIYEADYRFAKPPQMPALKAIAGDGKVILTWDDAADRLTREPMLKGANDFEGYKLYKSTDKRLSDAEIITDAFGDPAFRKPIYQCDLNNGIKGFADYGEINGTEFYLGNDTGIRHHFIDRDVQNGRTYYYAITAYDRGISDLEFELGPAENNAVIDLDEDENVRYIGPNVQIVTPHPKAAGYVSPSFEFGEESTHSDMGDVSVAVLDNNAIKENHTYKVKFQTNPIDFLRSTESFRSAFESYYTPNGFSVFDVTASDSMVYRESPDSPTDNLKYNEEEEYWYFNLDKELYSELFDGIRLNFTMTHLSAAFDPGKSGWVIGDAPIKVTLQSKESKYFPWQVDIVFTGEGSAYSTQTTSLYQVRAMDDAFLGPADLYKDGNFNFYAINKTFPDENGDYKKLDILVYDVNRNKVFDRDSDYLLFGYTKEMGRTIRWAGTSFILDFHAVNDESQMPRAGDIYRIDFKRPFFEQDSFLFTIRAGVEIEERGLENGMADIRVVPNPYVATNAMEEAIMNPYLNQRRKLMFTHVPAQCTIKIFTVSGVFVDEIYVDNPPDNGLVHWDLLSREGLEIAAGVYFYHVKSTLTGDEKLGKFAVIK